MKRLLFAAIVVCGSFAASPSRAEDPVRECVSDSENGQQLRDDGKLRDAREKFVACTRTECPKVVRRDCGRWLEDIEAKLPSVLLGARDPGGQDLADVRVTLDGAPFLDRLDGKAVPIDPGAHVFVFQADGFAPQEQRIVVQEGQKRRALNAVLKRTAVAGPTPLVLPPPPPPPPPPSGWNVPTASLILGGVGIVGGITFAGLWLSASSDARQLGSSCAPACSDGDVDPVRTRVVLADVALGVGAAAAVAAAVVYLVSHHERNDGAPARALASESLWGTGNAGKK